MTRPHGTGRDLIGQPLRAGRGSVPGVVKVTQGDTPMTKAPHDGNYVIDGTPYVMRKGQILPPGAVVVAVDEPEAEPVEERAQPAAPENKSRKAAPEQK